MVFVEHSTREKALRLLRSIQNDINIINDALRENENTESKLDATYVAGRPAVANSAGAEIIKKIRWFVEDPSQLNQTPPTAYTNTDIDALPGDIRGADDGN